MKSLSPEELIDISVVHNVVPNLKWHYMWEQYATWQFESLLKIGLLPEHRLLDIGCGPLRLGHLMIPYLEGGNYHGVDGFQPYLDWGDDLLLRLGIDKSKNVMLSSTFEFEGFGVAFDFANAQSVFTYMSKRQIEDCLDKLVGVMKPQGRLLFTFCLRDYRGFLGCGLQPIMRPGIDDEAYFHELASTYGITYTTPEFDHPSQRVGVFTF